MLSLPRMIASRSAGLGVKAVKVAPGGKDVMARVEGPVQR
jgi:hypothetical protein